MIPVNQDDLIVLNDAYHNNFSSFYTLYGAHKSGKSTFIRDFIVKKDYLYFCGFTTNKKILFSSYIDQINKKFKLKQSSRFYDTFESILSLIEEQNIDKKIAIIIEDFHEIIKIDKNSLKTLIHYWNQSLKNKPLTFIISINTKEYQKDLLKIDTYKEIYLEPFGFEFIKNKSALSPTDKFYIYSIFGSSSYFLSFYNTKIDLIKNVYKIIFEPSSPFYNYGFEYLNTILGENQTFNSILYAISIGNHKIGDIADFLNLKSTHLTRYMQKLQDLMIIQKELPISHQTKYSKFGRYYIKDHFLRFWFCYVYPNKTLLEIKKHHSVMRELDNTIKENILNPSYKNFIRNIINQNPAKYLGFIPKKIAPWWDNNNNSIDLIAYDNTQIVFVMIIWENKNFAMQQYNTLKHISENFKTTLKKNYLIISKNTYLNYFN